MTDPKPVELTEEEIAQLEAAERPFFITHNLGASGKHHTQLTVGGARAIAAIVTAREAAARREALLEAADVYSDFEVFVAADGINSLRTHGLAPDAWIRRYSERYTEPERDEEGGR